MTHTRWQSVSRYVDEETGEILNKDYTKRHGYIKIKTEKEITFTNTNKTHGIIRYTIRCRKHPQLGIWNIE